MPANDFDDIIDPRVQCSRCEAVCCRLLVMVEASDRVPCWYVEEDERGLARMAQGEDGWCVALDRDTLRCTIYETRPAACRDYAMGGILCRAEREDAARSGTLPLRFILRDE